jgi:NADP-dependent 3-hydroxy acid dehydrogenase YdfG
LGTPRPKSAAEQLPEPAQADGTVRPEPLMDVAEVVRAVRYMASLPLDTNVATMTIMATKMPFIWRG